MNKLDTQWWLELGKRYTSSTTTHNYCAAFGIPPETCARIWNNYLQTAPFAPIHFLWALAFMKQYSSMDTLYTRFCGSRTTFTYKIWMVIEEIIRLLPVVS